jgi:hypothetical protein
MPSKTVQETSTFDNWLKALEGVTRGIELVRALDAVAQLATEAFGARLWFVRTLGRRRSYIAGHRSQTPAGAAIDCIPLRGNIGCVSDGWGSLSDCERARLLAFLDGMVSLRLQP